MFHKRSIIRILSYLITKLNIFMVINKKENVPILFFNRHDISILNSLQAIVHH